MSAPSTSPPVLPSLTDEELSRLEVPPRVAEGELEQEIAEAERDAHEVTVALHEVRLRLEDAQQQGIAGLEATLAALRAAVAPSLPYEQHRARMHEAAHDALRARLWIVSAMREDLRRFVFELGTCVRLADEAREELVRVIAEPKVMVRSRRSPGSDRLERIRAVTANLVARHGLSTDTGPRRAQPRLRLETAIDLHSQSNFYTGITENISDGGLFLATMEPLEPGTEVDLAFSLPDGVEVRARGLVRWVRGESEGLARGVGIAFSYISQSAQDAIQRFIARREPIIHASAGEE